MQKGEALIKRLTESTDHSEEELKSMIKEKELEFSGLISFEGAAHIVAKELGVNLLEKKDVKISDIVPDLQSVHIIGKIMKKFDPREFTKGDKKGAVANIIIADETGQMRMSLWDEQIKLLEELKEGDVIQVLNGYTKEDIKGGAELRVGKRSLIKKSDVKIDAKTVKAAERSFDRKSIKDLNAGDNAELRAALVQIFENNPFFFVCPKCEKKVVDNKCATDGEVTPKPRLVANGVVDDGTGNIRAVMFADAAEKIFGLKTDQAFKISGNGINLKKLIEEYNKSLGKEYVMKGYVKMNNFFERPEFIVNDVSEVDPKEEAKAIMAKMGK